MGCKDRYAYYGSSCIFEPIALRTGCRQRVEENSYEVNPKTGLFDAEYVNIFGVPFTFLPHESTDGPPPPPPPPQTKIEPVKEKLQYEIRWPNIIRINHLYKPTLKLDMEKVKPIELNAYATATLVEMAPIIDGKPDITKISEIDLEDLGKKFRLQKIIFETARDIYDQMKPTWSGNKEFLLTTLIRIVEPTFKVEVQQKQKRPQAVFCRPGISWAGC